MCLKALENLGQALLKEQQIYPEHFQHSHRNIHYSVCPLLVRAVLLYSLGVRANNFQILKDFHDFQRSNDLETTCAKQSVLQCNYLFFQIVEGIKLLFSVVTQQQWVCKSSTQGLPACPLSRLIAAFFPLPPTSSFSSVLNKIGYIRTRSASRSSPVGHIHYQGGGNSDTLQVFYTFDFHLLIVW